MVFTALSVWQVMAVALGAAGVLAVLHLLRQPTREVRVVTTLFWSQAIEPSRPKSLFGRPRQLPAYILLALTCSLLALAMGRPQWIGPVDQRVNEVIILDAGSSMGARTPGGASRWEFARRALDREVAALGVSDSLAVIVADPVPRVLLPFEDTRAMLAGRLEPIGPGETPAAIDDAIRLAHSLLQGRAQARIALITDRHVEHALSRDESTAAYRTILVGESLPNAAIFSAVFELTEPARRQGRLVVRVGMAGEPGLEVTFEAKSAGAGEPLFSERRRLEPDSTADFIVPDVRADGGRMHVRLDVQDGLAADNQLAFVLPTLQPVRLAATRPLPTPLRLALESDPGIRMVESVDEGDVCIDPPDGWGGPSIRVRDSQVIPGGDSAVALMGEHALLEGLSFEQPDGEIAVSAPGGGGVLIARGDVLLAAWDETEAGPSLLLDSALWSQPPYLHRRADFPVFIARAVRQLAGRQVGPMTLTPIRAVQDPLWSTDLVDASAANVMPADRASVALTVPRSDTSAADLAGRGRRPCLAEWMLLLAFLGFVLDSWLYSRGRIA